MAEEFISLTEAQKILGVSRVKMWQLAKKLTLYTDPLDKRKKLVPRVEVERLKQPEAITQPAGTRKSSPKEL
jgi:hypothetical protein